MGVARGVAPFHDDSRKEARNNGQDRKRENQCRPDVPSQNKHGRFIGNSAVELTQKRITAGRPSVELVPAAGRRSAGARAAGRHKLGPMTTPRRAHLAFLCPMPMELRPVVKKLSLRKEKVGDTTIHSGTLDGRDVVAITTGMGTPLATAAIERLLEAVTVERVVVVGITGAVENVTPIGTLVIPEVVVHAGTGAEYRPAALGDQQPHGVMWTTDELITDLDFITGLRARGVISLDMETAAIAEVCERNAIPWSVFRVISDRATDGSVDEEVFRLSNQDGSPNGRAVARYFLTHPGRLPRMMRLARGAKLATDRAAEVAIRACRGVPA
jgi:adenosylhomocysteine nucleosidase